MMGIYVIKNTKDNKVYVGSAYNLEKRELEDFRLLRNKKHYSSKLQKIYNKYGKSIFLFELIEHIEKKKDLFKREQYYINLFNSFEDGFNCLSTKYKRITKTQKNDYFYEEFMIYYEKLKTNIWYGDTLRYRLLSKHYKIVTYRIHIRVFEWFMENYSLDHYDISFHYFKTSLHLWIITKNDNKYEKSYILKDGNIIINEHETGMIKGTEVPKNLIREHKQDLLDIQQEKENL